MRGDLVLATPLAAAALARRSGRQRRRGGARRRTGDRLRHGREPLRRRRPSAAPVRIGPARTARGAAAGRHLDRMRAAAAAKPCAARPSISGAIRDRFNGGGDDGPGYIRFGF